MNNKVRTAVFITTLSLLSINGLKGISESVAVRCPVPISDRMPTENENEDDLLDRLGDQEIARGHKAPVPYSGMLGWMAAQTMRAGSSLVLAYLAAQDWFGRVRLKMLAAWLWLKNRVTPAQVKRRGRKA